jgi:hypothetical protein
MAKGAMAGIVEDGVTGFLVDDVEAAVEAVSRLSSPQRSQCVQAARARFSDVAMAAGHAAV